MFRKACLVAVRWLGSVDNLNFLQNLAIRVIIGQEKNRPVYNQASELKPSWADDIPVDGLLSQLKEFDFVRYFGSTSICTAILVLMAKLQVEELLSVLKQVCQAERFYVWLSLATTSRFAVHCVR